MNSQIFILIFKQMFSLLNVCVVIKMAAKFGQLIYQPDPSRANAMFVNRADFISQKLTVMFNVTVTLFE